MQSTEKRYDSFNSFNVGMKTSMDIKSQLLRFMDVCAAIQVHASLKKKWLFDYSPQIFKGVHM